jgi:dolichyl-phosphate beta-glucosyltransferase
MKLSVIIPAYNESAVIETTGRAVVAYLQKMYPSDHELIIVDDGSTDDTALIVRERLALAARLISHELNQGKGAAVRTGMLAAQGEYLLFMDADNSTDISHVEPFMAAIEQADIVIGSRKIAAAQVVVAQNWFKRTLGRLGNSLIQLVLLPGIKDTQCGFKLYRSRCLDLFKAQQRFDFAFDFEILYLAQQRGMIIKELPVRWVNNFDTRVKPWSYVTTLIALFSVKYHYWKGDYNL